MQPQPLGTSIRQTERHHMIFKLSKRCIESRFLLIPLLDTDKMVGISQVKLGEEPGPVERTEGRGTDWRRQGAD